MPLEISFRVLEITLPTTLYFGICANNFLHTQTDYKFKYSGKQTNEAYFWLKKTEPQFKKFDDPWVMVKYQLKVSNPFKIFLAFV